MSSGQQGIATSTVLQSPQRRKRRAKARKNEEARWAAKCGPVTVRFVDPAELAHDPAASQNTARS